MTCEVIRLGRPAMAKAGWSDEEITALELKLELAERKAETEAFTRGMTAAEQRAAIKSAREAVIKVAHDRHHRELGDLAREIERMAEHHKAHPNTHYSPNRIRVPAGKKED